MPNNSYIKTDNCNVIVVDSIISVNCFELAPNFIIENDVHDYWEFLYVDGGEVCYTEGNISGKLRQGDVVFHSPGKIHSTFCNGKQSASFFNVIFDCSSDILMKFDKKALRVPRDLTFLLKKLIAECNRSYYTSSYPLKMKEDAPLGGSQLAKLYIEEFLILMLRTYEKKESVEAEQGVGSSQNSDLTEQICSYLAENIYNRVTLKELTDHFHFGKSYLCEQFKKIMGISVMNYHLELKITAAKQILREQNIQIKEVAELLGFDSPDYFSRYFKKKVGYTPKEFKKMLINDANLKKRN